MQEGDRAVVERHLHELTASRALSLLEREQDRDGRIHAGREIDDGHADANRRTIRLAVEAHEARHRLYHGIVAGIAAERAIGAEARDAAMDEPREALLQHGLV